MDEQKTKTKSQIKICQLDEALTSQTYNTKHCDKDRCNGNGNGKNRPMKISFVSARDKDRFMNELKLLKGNIEYTGISITTDYTQEERLLIKELVEKAKAEAESKRLQGQGIADQRREIARGLEESVDVLNNVGINSQEASALIVVTQHYDTLQSIGEETGSNLILLPNSPQAGSEMLNNMVASFTASNQIGEAMKAQNIKDKNELDNKA